MWVESKILLRFNLIKVNEEKNEDKNDNENTIITNFFKLSDFSALKRLTEDSDSKSDRFLSYLTITARKIRSSFFNK